MMAANANAVKKPDQLTVSSKLNQGGTIRRRLLEYSSTGSGER